MVKCCAYMCKNNSSKKQPGISFHRFPSDPSRRSEWIRAVKRVNWTPADHDRICSLHFEAEFFYTTPENKVKLLNEAVPSIFTEFPKPQTSQARKRCASQRSSQDISDPQPSTSTQLDTPRKKKLRRRLFQEVEKRRELTKRLKTVRQSLRRCKKKIISLKQIIKELRDKNLLSLEHSLVVENMPKINTELLKRKSKKGKYSADLRKFAVTLMFFSPKAYDYVRRVFDTCLPHRSTVGKWFQSIDAAPGFTKESINTLRKHVESSEKPTICSLILDEMSIRQHLEWDGKRFHGYVNFGMDFNTDSNELAKDALVFMVVCINGTWKIPVGYFFTAGVSGEQRASLVKQCIQLVEETGVRIVSVTCDGAPSNIAMARILGCTLEYPNVNTNMTVTNHSVYLFLDPCHMVKLVRNTFGEKKIIHDAQGNPILWDYVQSLHDLQENEGLHLGNKLRAAHIQFFKQKMKVRLAVQLLSESVADSLEYCKVELRLPEFDNCMPRVRFIRLMNNIFDLLNSRSLTAYGFKKALCSRNIELNTTFIHEAISYISGLRFDNNELVIRSARKTGFIGLIISLTSSLKLYADLVDVGSLIYLPLYKCSQDHLELFFSSIRSRGGWNNNPTSRQFTASYKRLLIRAEIREGGIGNCIPLDQIPILVSSSKTTSQSPEEIINSSLPQMVIDTDSSWDEDSEIIWDHDYIMNFTITSEYSQQVIIYIAGFVSFRLQQSLKCEICIAALIGDKSDLLHSLISQKSHGKLTYPSKDVIKLCQQTEHLLRIHQADMDKKKDKFQIFLISKIMSVCIEQTVFQKLKRHDMDNPVSHIYFLIKSVCTYYLKIRIHFITKKRSEPTDPIRTHLTRTILFSGQ